MPETSPNKLTVAVVGATGAVGRTMIQVLTEKQFPYTELRLLASARSAGTTVAVLTPAVAQDLNLPFDSKGVVVTQVTAGSPADDMGLRKGDIITAIDGRQIGDVATFKSLVSKRTDGWQIVLNRNGQVIQTYISG